MIEKWTKYDILYFKNNGIFSLVTLIKPKISLLYEQKWLTFDLYKQKRVHIERKREKKKAQNKLCSNLLGFWLVYDDFKKWFYKLLYRKKYFQIYYSFLLTREKSLDLK